MFRRHSPFILAWTLVLTFLLLAACNTSGGNAEPPEEPVIATTEVESPPPSLKTVDVPLIPSLSRYVKDEKAAVVLGKAMFWDIQVGSDGLACASCHFHAGADSRIKNQLNPGLRAVTPDANFDPTASGRAGGPNYRMRRSDFPFHKLADPADRNSQVLSTTNDVFSSQGSFNGIFDSSPPDAQDDICDRMPDAIFHVNNIGTRRVEPRNTPTVINAVFNFRTFWDGRGNNTFNGVDPFGLRNGSARVWRSSGKGVKKEKVSLRNASLASQGVGPVVSDIEMICSGRSFASFGRKMLARVPLALQKVHPEDGVLGPYVSSSKGLTTTAGEPLTYEGLIKRAFKDRYWKALGPVDGEFSQMESNFSLFWGLALQLYQATLVSDDAPYDRWAEGDSSALTRKQKRGLDVFMNKGKCINCHKGPEFSGAASVLQAEAQEGGLVERMAMNDGGVALYDNGFYNIGVTPTNDDLGVGALGDFGKPLSFTEQYRRSRFVDKFKVDTCTFEVPFDDADCTIKPSRANLAKERVAVKGAFKTPTLRNVELTGPYFHNGGTATLLQVAEFYDRGGNFINPELDPDITPLGLTDREKRDLVAFMVALTDPRVKQEQAPFDHPQLFIPNGHPGHERRTQGGAFQQHDMAFNEWLVLPAVGQNGRAAEGLDGLQRLESTLNNLGPDLKIARPFSNYNNPPVMHEVPDRESYVGEPVDERFTASDEDGNRILYSASGLPPGVRLRANGRLVGAPKVAGEYMVTIIAYDGQLGTAIISFIWNVFGSP